MAGENKTATRASELLGLNKSLGRWALAELLLGVARGTGVTLAAATANQGWVGMGTGDRDASSFIFQVFPVFLCCPGVQL